MTENFKYLHIFLEGFNFHYGGGKQVFRPNKVNAHKDKWSFSTPPQRDSVNSASSKTVLMFVVWLLLVFCSFWFVGFSLIQLPVDQKIVRTYAVVHIKSKAICTEKSKEILVWINFPLFDIYNNLGQRNTLYFQQFTLSQCLALFPGDPYAGSTFFSTNGIMDNAPYLSTYRASILSQEAGKAMGHLHRNPNLHSWPLACEPLHCCSPTPHSTVTQAIQTSLDLRYMSKGTLLSI